MTYSLDASFGIEIVLRIFPFPVPMGNVFIKLASKNKNCCWILYFLLVGFGPEYLPPYPLLPTLIITSDGFSVSLILAIVFFRFCTFNLASSRLKTNLLAAASSSSISLFSISSEGF